ncbi:MAG: hypothetical protein ABWZ25_11890 [Chitinophagaceae bacterium]
MTPLFKKLNFREQSEIIVLNPPASFDAELKSMSSATSVRRDLKKKDEVSFAMIFATTQQELDKYIPMILPNLVPDAVLWFCYPKGSSKKYSCDFNRDTGWDELKKSGYDTVRAVAVDEDWSALRFRRNEFIGR